MGARARLPPDQGGLGLSRESYRCALRIRMARHTRQLVSQLWERELGVRRDWIDATAHCKHQRCVNSGVRAKIPLAARTPPARPPVTQCLRVLAYQRRSVLG